MSKEARVIRRPGVAGVVLVVAAGLIAGGCSSSSSSSSALSCPSKRGAAVTGTAPAATGRPAAGWAIAALRSAGPVPPSTGRAGSA